MSRGSVDDINSVSARSGQSTVPEARVTTAGTLATFEP